MTTVVDKTFKRDVRSEWVETCRREIEQQPFIRIHTEALAHVIGAMKAVDTSDYWRVYVSDVDDANPNLDKLAYEMALATGLNGGFVTVDDDRVAHKWEKNGSGTDAMVDLLRLIRAYNAMPEPELGKTIDVVREDVQSAIILSKIPQRTERFTVFERLGTNSARNFIIDLVNSAKDGDTYRFTCDHVLKLARQYSTIFGGDEPFHKKASLYFLLMGRALEDLGHKVSVETLVPSEYRLPQVFMVFGAITVENKKLNDALANGTPLEPGSDEVRALRQASVILTEEIKRLTNLSIPDIDAALFMMTKKPEFKAIVAKMGIDHMKVPTPHF